MRETDELSFTNHHKSQQHVPMHSATGLSSTNTDDEDDVAQASGISDQEEDYGATGGGSTTRDVLLLKCRDAIESLHQEIEEERTEKAQLS